MFFVEGKVSNGTICMNVDREFWGIPRRTASQLIEFFDNRELIAQKKAMTSQEAKVAIRLDGFRMEMAEAVGVSIKTVFKTVYKRQSLLKISDESVLFKPLGNYSIMIGRKSVCRGLVLQPPVRIYRSRDGLFRFFARIELALSRRVSLRTTLDCMPEFVSTYF